MATGLAQWAVAIVAHAGPLFGFLALVFRRVVHPSPAHPPPEKLIWYMAGWILGIVTAFIIIMGITRVRDRYLQPFFVYLPIVLSAALRPQINLRRLAITLTASAVIAAGVLLVAPGRVLVTERLRKNEVLNNPFRNLAHDLKPFVQNAECIVAENHTLGGNLRLWFPDKLVVDPEIGPLFPPVQRRVVLVWNATDNPLPPRSLMEFVYSFTGGTALGNVTSLEERLRYHHARTIKVSIAAVQ